MIKTSDIKVGFKCRFLGTSVTITRINHAFAVYKSDEYGDCGIVRIESIVNNLNRK